MGTELKHARVVFIVEDDADVRAMLAQALELEGYRVAAAENGQDALDKLHAASPPCLILLDLMMPVMNGWQFMAAQATDPELARIPVVVLSGDATLDKKAESLGATGFLRKPVTIDALLETVEKFS
ncbi:MAG: response regulator [Deltaproteobacteria bacterium]|nr:response regulator [Deltaproteobacteria bacterium]